jgi:hypothetical protein
MVPAPPLQAAKPAAMSTLTPARPKRGKYFKAPSSSRFVKPAQSTFRACLQDYLPGGMSIPV